MQGTEKKKPKKKPEGADIPDLPDFRTWGKEEGKGPEPEAAPPAMEQQVVVAPKMDVHPESEEKVAVNVQKATFVMHHCYSAALQIVEHETGANQPIIDTNMNPGMPAPLVHQIAVTLGKAMFDRVYTKDLEGSIEFIEVQPEKK